MSGQPLADEQERERWERLRRALVKIVAQMAQIQPESRYTLRIEVVPKEATETSTR